MQKELNPNLFQFQTQHSKGQIDFVEAKAATVIAPSQPSAAAIAIQSEYHKQLLALQEQVEKLSHTFVESQKNTQLKIDRCQYQVGRLENQQNQSSAEVNAKIHHLSQRNMERQNIDIKVQEMIDRHNSVVKTFEVRLNQLQKLLAEKEAQYRAVQASLSEAKMEIMRLKRL